MSGIVDSSMTGLQAASAAKTGAMANTAQHHMSTQRMRAVAEDFERKGGQFVLAKAKPGQ